MQDNWHHTLNVRVCEGKSKTRHKFERN
ncbi:hypothetical protein MTR67_016274 [Solanum verrucosum]|uniref:Uncharacterized protein n=1 Tax=Solanum verrucosum TaxID=315347 RepID=A0AAF0QFT8_SOLVR|nr:hypothetical protein MTR67_016274 [Solanum verrucosum]